MSERGHWTTELVWCKDCARTLHWYFCASGEWRNSSVCIPTLHTGKYRIFAGLVRGLYAGEEVHIFEGEVTDELEKQLCHSVTFWVFAEAQDAPCSVTINPVETGISADG